MIGCLRTRVCKQPIIALYCEFENVPSSEDKASCPMTQQNASGGDQTRDL